MGSFPSASLCTERSLSLAWSSFSLSVSKGNSLFTSEVASATHSWKGTWTEEGGRRVEGERRREWEVGGRRQGEMGRERGRRKEWEEKEEKGEETRQMKKAALCRVLYRLSTYVYRMRKHGLSTEHKYVQTCMYCLL